MTKFQKMKKISVVWITGICLILSGIPAFSQTVGKVNTSVIEPYHLAITSSMTTNLIFPYSIKSVDRGSLDVLAQKAPGVDNILQIKAGKENFEETNLTVITGDGKLFSFVLDYAQNPSVLNLVLGKALSETGNNLLTPGNYNEAEIKSYAKKAMLENKKWRGVKDKQYGITFRLNGLFIHHNMMYYRIKIENYSSINYDIEQLRFFIRDQKKVKRTASQEIEIKPVYIQNNTSTITSQTSHTFVFAIPKFTIPDKKYLTIQLMEKNGGRHLALKIHNRKIVKAVPMD